MSNLKSLIVSDSTSNVIQVSLCDEETSGLEWIGVLHLSPEILSHHLLSGASVDDFRSSHNLLLLYPTKVCIHFINVKIWECARVIHWVQQREKDDEGGNNRRLNLFALCLILTVSFQP